LPKLYKILRSTEIRMLATPTVENRVSPRVASSPYVPTDVQSSSIGCNTNLEQPHWPN